MSRPIDTHELRLFFENSKYPGIVRMLDFVLSEEGRGFEQIGSGTVDPFAIPHEPGSVRPQQWRELRIGVPGKETPLESLAKVMHHAETLPPEALFAFDRICDELIAAYESAIPWEDLPEEEKAKFL